jgi:transcriptional regulator with XRE-family HTH domain
VTRRVRAGDEPGPDARPDDPVSSEPPPPGGAVGPPDLQQRLRDLGGFIRDQRHRERLSVRSLSELAGISNPYLSQIERGLRKPSAEILQGIARGLRISAETLYVRAGILDADGPGGGGDLVAAIRADDSISARHRELLVELYRSFQREHRHGDPDAG